MSESMTMHNHIAGIIKAHLNRRIVGVSMLLIVFIYIVTMIPTMIAYADQSQTRTRAYKSIQISSGDTLWSIASENYTEEWESIPEYIDVIKTCNSLGKDDITAGCYLVIPYYTETADVSP